MQQEDVAEKVVGIIGLSFLAIIAAPILFLMIIAATQ
jgi:hypothetical protein